MLPADLQRRQAAVASAADQQLQQALAAERRQFEAERRQLDRQLAEQQALLAEREAELLRVEQERRRQQELEEARRQRDRIEMERQQEEERLRQQQRLRQREREDAQLWLQQGQLQQQQQQQPLRPDGLQFLEPRQLPRQLDLPVLQLSPAASGASYSGQPQQRRSVSAALAAVAGSPSLADHSGGLSMAAAAAPAASYVSSRHVSPSAAAPRPLPRANGSLAPRPGLGSSLRVAATGLGAGLAQPPQPARAAGAAGGVDEDPLARARRQVLAAKSYLRQISAQADMHGRPPASGPA